MKNFYLKSWVIENLILKVGDFLLGTEVIKQLKLQRSYAFLNHEQLQKLQMEKLDAILNHATKTCTAYEKYSNHSTNDPQKWLGYFPILTKKEINSKSESFISRDYNKKKLIRYESSGSTGFRSTVYLDKIEQSITRAILINWWEWNGYYFGKPVLQTGMTPKRGFIKSLKDYILSTEYLNAFDLSENEIMNTLSRIKNKKNIHFFGYASSLFEIAKVANKNNYKKKFDLTISQGDKLFDHYKKTIKETFDCEVVEDYGLSEGFMVGQQKDLPYFYIYTPNVYLEILDEREKPVKDGQMGRIILTKLDGFAMPLIRFDTGDLGIVLPAEKYPEKRDLAFPLLEKVVGRNTDVIKTEDGKALIVHTFTGIFEFYPEIEQFQVIQNSINKIIIKYIPAENFIHEILSIIEKDFRDKTKSSINIKWEKVSEIRPSGSGKPQIIVNHLISNSLTNVI